MTRIRISVLVPLAAAFLLSACAKDRTVAAAPTIELTDLEALPEPDTTGSITIAPLEQLEIRVVGVELLTGSYAVDEDGMLQFPFIGAIESDNISTSALARRIADGLRGRYVKDPQVVVRSTRDLKRSVSIGGQVGSPGTYDATASKSLIRAVNNAGGMSEYAQTDDVLILRKVDGRNYIGVYNLGAIQRGNYADPPVYPNDIIMVGDSPSKRLLQKILAVVPLLTTSVVLVDRIAN